MPLQEVINCAPFRLAAQRSYTAYEWNIIGTTFAQYMTPADAQALTVAVQTQPCAEWRTSIFGPAPCVSTRWYDALGAWFGQLDAASKAFALADIQKGLLCASGTPPWAGFDKSKRVGTTKIYIAPSAGALYDMVAWEGEIQNPSAAASRNVANLEPCASLRSRTQYIPVRTGDVVSFVRMMLASPSIPGMPSVTSQLGLGSLPPFLLQMLQNAPVPTELANKTFLLGIEINASGTGSVFETMALIWAPGKGADRRPGLGQDGKFNMPAVIAILTLMLPDIVGGFLQIPPQVAVQIPQIAAQIPGVFTAATQMAGSIFGGGKPMQGLGGILADGSYSPQTAPTTGLPIIDDVQADGGGAGGTVDGGIGSAGAWAGVAVAVALLALVVGYTQSRD